MVPLTTKDHGFLGAVHDSNALVLLGARFLDPSSGTFVSVDPLLDPLNPAQFNAYVYSGNNPVTWSDPTGLTWRMDDDHPDGGYRLDGASSNTSANSSGQSSGGSESSGSASDGSSTHRQTTSPGDIGARWNEAWGGFGTRWNEAWGGFDDRWNEAWAAVPERWNRAWAAFVDNPQGRSWRGVGENVNAGFTGSACALVCVQLGVGQDGFSYGFGVGLEMGASYSIGAGAKLPAGWSIRGEAEIAPGPVGVYGEFGRSLPEGQLVIGGGYTSGAKVGVAVWAVNEVPW